MALHPDANDFDEFIECPRCGGGGDVEWDDAPDLWGDDMGESLENHLVSCPDCAGKGGWRPAEDDLAKETHNE